MSGTLQLTLLGQTDVRLAGQPVTGFYSGKAQALLFYLAVTGQSHTRPEMTASGELNELLTTNTRG